MAGATVAKLNILLSANTGALAGDLSKAQGMLTGFSGKVSSAGGGGGAAGMLGGLVTKASLATGAIAGIGALVAGATWATKLAADAQKMGVSFEVMLGSADKAKAMISDIQGFAASTPFESTEIAAAAKSLLAFGVAQQDVIPSMRMLGDLSSGLNIPIGELSDLYGKAKVQGRLFMEDINQLTGRGIPIIGQLAKNFGVAEGEIRGMVERGQVGFPQLQAALFDLTKEGSQFGGMMEKQSQTFWGQLSTLWDNIKIAVGGVGGQFIGILTSMLKQVNAALESWNKFWGNSPDAKAAGALTIDASARKPAEMKKVDDAAQSAAKALADLQKQGEAFTNALRTPFEIIHDNVTEAHRLLEAGVISADTYSRSLAKAREDLAQQARSAREIREQLSAQMGGPVAALQFGTQAAISGVNAAQREAKLQLDTQRLIVAEQRATNERLKKIENAVRGQKPVNVKEVPL